MPLPRFLDEERGGLCPRLFPTRPRESLLFGGLTFEARWRLLLEAAGAPRASGSRLLVIHSLSLPTADLVRAIAGAGEEEGMWTSPDGRPVAALVDGGRVAPGEPPLLGEVCGGLPIRGSGGEVIDNVWSLVTGNGERIVRDLALLGADGGANDGEESAAILGDGAVRIGAGAAIEPHVLLDTRAGPIRIGAGATVEAHAVLRGPVWIGEGAIVRAGARLGGGTTLGKGSRAGGEVEATVFGAFSNKQHEGFLGHAYVGEWANLGAGTNNSDLKNNYGAVRIDWGEGTVETGLTKLGCFLGDDVKSAIGTRIGTGAVVGAASNLFGPSGLVTGYVPPFTWGEEEDLYDFARAVDTMNVVRGRRREALEKAGRPLRVAEAGVARLKELWEERLRGRA